VLKDAGLLAGRRFTSHAGVLPELPDSRVGERVVEDGQLVTSRGAATSIDFGLALVRRLCGEEKLKEVEKGIMA
jgi:4-methyl-5(b-hydroxyethyl)-thiazole monophosphate biosynthesis